MRELSDEKLQNYLDGRLPEGERAEVEARLRADPELARRVESWREMGRALREDEAGLSPGFYARARERFELAAGGRRRGSRFLSWEAAGLAAAIVLATAIFIPELVRDPDLGRQPAGRPAPADRDAVRRDTPAQVGERREGTLADAVAPEDAPAAPESEREAGRRKRAGALAQAVALDEAPAAPEPGLSGEAGAAGPAVTPPSVSRETQWPARGQPPVSAARAEAETARSEVERPRSTAAKPSRPVAKTAARAEIPAGDAHEEGFAPVPATVVGHVTTLPEGVRVADGILVVRGREDWDAWLGGPAAEALAPLGVYDAGRRLVLVGLRGADCSSLAVSRLPEGYRVAVGHGGASAGCAFLLPDDGLPVDLQP